MTLSCVNIASDQFLKRSALKTMELKDLLYKSLRGFVMWFSSCNIGHCKHLLIAALTNYNRHSIT